MDTLALRSTPPPGATRDDGSLDPPHAGAPSEELAVALYEHMVIARSLDERVSLLGEHERLGERERERPLGRRHGGTVGHEATILGAVAAMHDEDWVFPSSRDAAAALWRGIPLAACAKHLLADALVDARFAGACNAGKGCGAPDPPLWKAARIVRVSPLAGTQISHAVGVAWAARMRSDDLAALVFFDEGAAVCGDFHAGLNFAGVMRAPVVAVCRSTVSRAPDAAPTPGVAARAVAYGLQGVAVDGGDAVAVLRVVREARERAAAGLGATIIEALVAGGPGTQAQDDGAGDTPGPERPPATSADPIARMRLYLEGRNLWSAEREHSLLLDVRADVDRAVAEAAAAGKPARDTLFDDVYASLTWPLREQRGA
jgi:pyruvate dehydrogenase E1 component alpha subunit